MKKDAVKKYVLEFFTILISILVAFALDRWNENRKDHNAASKILTEIHNGLSQDLKDLEVNEKGHEQGSNAVQYIRKVINNKPVGEDSLSFHYFNLFRSFVAIQNTSGYESLKSKGLELIQNDSLRLHILALYENDYNTIRKLEETYSELQFHENYFKEFNTLFVQLLKTDTADNQLKIDAQKRMPENDKKIITLYLWRMQTNRAFASATIKSIKEKIKKLQTDIQKELQ